MARGTIVGWTDALQGFLGEVTALAASPDADLDFVLELRQMVLDKLSGEADMAAGGAGEAGMSGPVSSASPPAMPPGGMTGEMPRGPMPGPPQPNPNELERMLAGS